MFGNIRGQEITLEILLWVLGLGCVPAELSGSFRNASASYGARARALLSG